MALSRIVKAVLLAAAICLLSAGLGSEPGIPRSNNLPELVVADLVTEQKGA